LENLDKELDGIFIIMVIYFMENGKKIKRMDSVCFIIQTKINIIKDFGKIINEMVMENFIMMPTNIIKVIG